MSLKSKLESHRDVLQMLVVWAGVAERRWHDARRPCDWWAMILRIRSKTVKRLKLVTLILSATLGTPAAAQYSSDGLTNIFIDGSFERNRIAMQGLSNGAFLASQNGQAENAARQQALVTCRKTHDGCNSRFVAAANVHPGPAYIAGQVGKTPADKQVLAVQATQYLTAYGGIAGQLGLPRNEVAGPLAFCFLSAMQVYRGESVSISRSAAQAVLGQARQMLANNGNAVLMPNDKRLLRYETLAIVGVHLNAEISAAKAAGDAPRAAKAQALARQMIKDITGVAPEQLTVTAQGVVQAGANAPPPGEIAGGSTRFVYDTGLNVAGKMAAASSGAMLDSQTRGYLATFYQQLAARDGRKDDLADVLALVMAGYFCVYSNGQTLTPRQFAGTVTFARQRIIASAEMQRASDQQKQTVAEGQIIEMADILRRYENNRQGGNIDTAQNLARANLNVLLAPDRVEQFRLTPDGFAR